jgi:hypothetical protein
MKRIPATLFALVLAPSIASAEWSGSSWGRTTVDTGNQDIAVHAFRNTSPLIVGVQNNSQEYVRCSARFSHLPVIDETRSALVAPGGTAALINRQGYLTARIDTDVKCSQAQHG